MARSKSDLVGSLEDSAARVRRIRETAEALKAVESIGEVSEVRSGLPGSTEQARITGQVVRTSETR